MSALQNVPRITPFLWFDANAEEAVDFYLSVFKNSRRIQEFRMPEEGNGNGKILTIAFDIEGVRFTALNGGPHFKFNEAVSFVIACEDQAEIDYYWSKLTSGGGAESQCGWLKDKFGLSWQVAPSRWPDLIKHPKAMQAMMGMKKLDIAELERAGKS
jgi:predicted 3-demethylubiquinone-9 3-methyltransferase (glyoxalase superfamily)